MTIYNKVSHPKGNPPTTTLSSRGQEYPPQQQENNALAELFSDEEDGITTIRNNTDNQKTEPTIKFK